VELCIGKKPGSLKLSPAILQIIEQDVVFTDETMVSNQPIHFLLKCYSEHGNIGRKSGSLKLLYG